MNQQNIKEKQKTNIGSVILLIGLLLIFAGVAIITFSKEEQTENNPSEESKSEVENRLGQTIELSKETEDITFDENLRIKFIGTKSTDVENGYKYKAEIYLNNELINNNFFAGDNIYSNAYAANIKVSKVENTYFIISTIAKQCSVNNVLVITTDKKAMTSYKDISIEIDEKSNNYTITKCTDCMNEATCEKTTVDIPKLTK